MLGAIAAVGLVAGCSTSVDGEPAAQGQSETTREQTVQWNPCTDLADEAVEATRANPASKSTVTDASSGPAAFRICSWDSTEGPYKINVGSSTYSLDDVRNNPDLTGFREVEVGTRTGLINQQKSDEDKLHCWVNLPWAKGMVYVSVGWSYSKRTSIPQSPPCDLAVEHAIELDPYLPK
ncbi:DUF3558 domain-containing protein [Nocardia cyriacigeorgica]|nr:DUF3558 domain-containing protein [Nocardia cyriacigeorgica]